MTSHEPTRRFETEIEIRAPRDAVWKAIATDAGLRRWFATEASVEPREGGELVWEWKDLHTWRQRIESWAPARRLRTRYDSPVDAPGGGKVPLFIEFLLEGEGGTTTLRLVQSGFGADASFDEEYDGISRGWPVELRSLRLYLERHPGLERRLVWKRAAVQGDPAEAWALLTGPEGLGCGAAADRLAEGEPFRCETADGDVFEGTALACNERELTGVVTSHGDAFLRVTVESCHGSSWAQLWLGLYGRDESEIRSLEGRLGARFDRLFSRAGSTR